MKFIKDFNNFVNEELVAVGFGPQTRRSFSVNSTNPTTGYSMKPIVTRVSDLGSDLVNEAKKYEGDNNPNHKAKEYLKEAKKFINRKIDEMYEASCKDKS